MTDIPVLYEDLHVLVINKPPGIVVNRAQSVQEQTIQDWAEERIGSNTRSVHNEEDRVFVERAGIAHRLDKETSGCLVLTKNPEALSHLMRQFKERIPKKKYIALVHGIVVPKKGEIRAPVGRLPWNRERFGILPGGKEAVTKFVVHSSWSISHGKQKQELSLVELCPETGRTHQLRVHMKHINHPVIGDWQYAGRKTARNDRKWAPRVMLHAQTILFEHPVSGKLLEITAPIPDDMNRIIRSHDR